jgi:hypothetical protein
MWTNFMVLTRRSKTVDFRSEYRRVGSAAMRHACRISIAVGLATACVAAPVAAQAATHPTKQQFVSEANHLCRKVLTDPTTVAAFHALSSMHSLNAFTPAKMKAKAPALESLQSAEQGWLDQLKALPEPSGESSQLNALWTALDQEVSVTGRLVKAFKDGSLSEFISLTKPANKADARWERLTKAYGLSACAHA